MSWCFYSVELIIAVYSKFANAPEPLLTLDKYQVTASVQVDWNGWDIFCIMSNISPENSVNIETYGELSELGQAFNK